MHRLDTDNIWRNGRVVGQGHALHIAKCNPSYTRSANYSVLQIQDEQNNGMSTAPHSDHELLMGCVVFPHGTAMEPYERYDCMEGTYSSPVKVDSDDGMLPFN